MKTFLRFSLTGAVVLLLAVGMAWGQTVRSPISPFPSDPEAAAHLSKMNLTMHDQLFAVGGLQPLSNKKAADWLVTQQNAAGWFPWTPSGSATTNTQGPSARGLLKAYELTGNVTYLNKAIATGNYMLNTLYVPGTGLSKYSDGDPRFATHDPLFLEELSIVTGNSSYADFVQIWFWNKLSATAYGEANNLDAAGFGQAVVNGRTAQGIVALSPWDLSATAIAAHVAGETAIRDALMGKILVGLNATTASTTSYDVIGLAGAIWASAVTGYNLDPTTGRYATANSTAHLADTLDGWTLTANNGAWLYRSTANPATLSNGDTQVTAFAIMALDAHNRPSYLVQIARGVAFIRSLQQSSGQFLVYPGAAASATGGVEVHAEAISGIVTVSPSEVYVDDDFASSSVGVDPTGPAIALGYDGFDTIMDGIDAVKLSTVYVAAGTYNENVNVNKKIHLVGAGSGSTPASNTIITPPSGIGINISASGASASDRLVIKDLRVSGASTNGIEITAANARYLTLDNVASVSNGLHGLNTNPPTNARDFVDFLITNSNFSNNSITSGNGIRFASYVDMDGLVISGCELNNNYMGYVDYVPVPPGGPYPAVVSVRNVSVTNTTFNNNAYKGIYTEKLKEAVFNNITVSNSGTVATGHAAGVDVNLKFAAYQNIQFLNSTISACGTADPNGGGMLIKARSDGGTYGTYPATLANVTLSNLFVSGNGGGTYGAGIRIGESNNAFTGTNTGPTNVVITNSSITSNAAHGLRNATVGTVADASANWWGSADPTVVSPMIFGLVDFTPILNSGTDTALGTPGFQPDMSMLTVHALGSQVGPVGRIQEGINLVTASTVYVAAGTYTEDVLINKPLSLIGANANIPYGPSRGPESKIQPATLGMAPIGLTGYGTSDNVTINGFELTGTLSNNAIYCGADGASYLDIKFNYIHDIGTARGTGNVYAINYRVNAPSPTDVNISDNYFDEVLNGTSAALGHSAAIWVGQSTANGTVSNLTIARNTIKNVKSGQSNRDASGIYIGVAWGTGTGSVNAPIISSNEITDISGGYAYGIQLSGKTPGAVVRNNIIDNIHNAAFPTPAAFGVGIPNTNTGSATIAVNNNSITTVLYAVANGTANIVNVTCNWYGVTSAAAVAAKISGPVTYAPWLMNGTDNSTDPGFQPVPGSCTGGVEDRNFVELHIVNQNKSTACLSNAPSCKMPLANVVVKVFDRNNVAFQAAYSKNPDGSKYAVIFDANIGKISECTTGLSGWCSAFEPTVGDYLVIVKWVDQAPGGKTVYTGKPKGPGDFVNGVATKEFQILKTIRKDGIVQYSGGSKTVVNGSYLEIIYPDLAVWENVTAGYVYPFIFTSDGDWSVDVCARVPGGYKIVGVYDENGNFVGDSRCSQSFISGETKVIAFDVVDLKSPPPRLDARLKVKHKGKVKDLDLGVPGLRKGIDRGPSGSQIDGDQMIEWESESIPKDYALYDCYPNPFNPTTNIRFDIPSPSVVTLKVYDVLGREVAALVDNEHREAGRYEVTFDASRLASGVYFYRLSAGSFQSLKKMMLLK